MNGKWPVRIVKQGRNSMEKCPKCDKRVLDIRNYPKWCRDGSKSAKLYVHARKVVGGLFVEITDSCLVVKSKEKVR